MKGFLFQGSLFLDANFSIAKFDFCFQLIRFHLSFLPYNVFGALLLLVCALKHSFVYMIMITLFSYSPKCLDSCFLLPKSF